MKLGSCTVVTFGDLPERIQQCFIEMWRHHFTVDTEYAQTEDELIERKKRSTFLYLTVEANGSHKATEKASDLADECVDVLRFLYRHHFPVNECYYISEDGKNLGGRESVGERFRGSARFVELFEKGIQKLTDIMTRSNPTQIEQRIRNALRIFGIQTTLANEQLRFVLLLTCLESLLLSGSDRDYIGWKLAEKTAFLLGKNRRKTNEYVKQAYGIRSAFIHGNTRQKEKTEAEDELHNMENLVVSVFWKLIELREQGYATIQKKKNVKNVEDYIEKLKFGQT